VCRGFECVEPWKRTEHPVARGNVLFECSPLTAAKKIPVGAKVRTGPDILSIRLGGLQDPLLESMGSRFTCGSQKITNNYINVKTWGTRAMPVLITADSSNRGQVT
jgi:hypothetical protein